MMFLPHFHRLFPAAGLRERRLAHMASPEETKQYTDVQEALRIHIDAPETEVLKRLAAELMTADNADLQKAREVAQSVNGLMHEKNVAARVPGVFHNRADMLRLMRDTGVLSPGTYERLQEGVRLREERQEAVRALRDGMADPVMQRAIEAFEKNPSDPVEIMKLALAIGSRMRTGLHIPASLKNEEGMRALLADARPATPDVAPSRVRPGPPAAPIESGDTVNVGEMINDLRSYRDTLQEIASIERGMEAYIKQQKQQPRQASRRAAKQEFDKARGVVESKQNDMRVRIEEAMRLERSLVERGALPGERFSDLMRGKNRKATLAYIAEASTLYDDGRLQILRQQWLAQPPASRTGWDAAGRRIDPHDPAGSRLRWGDSHPERKLTGQEFRANRPIMLNIDGHAKYFMVTDEGDLQVGSVIKQNHWYREMTPEEAARFEKGGADARFENDDDRLRRKAKAAPAKAEKFSESRSDPAAARTLLTAMDAEYQRNLNKPLTDATRVTNRNYELARSHERALGGRSGSEIAKRNPFEELDRLAIDAWNKLGVMTREIDKLPADVRIDLQRNYSAFMRTVDRYRNERPQGQHEQLTVARELIIQWNDRLIPYLKDRMMSTRKTFVPSSREAVPPPSLDVIATVQGDPEMEGKKLREAASLASKIWNRLPSGVKTDDGEYLYQYRDGKLFAYSAWDGKYRVLNPDRNWWELRTRPSVLPEVPQNLLDSMKTNIRPTSGPLSPPPATPSAPSSGVDVSLSPEEQEMIKLIKELRDQMKDSSKMNEELTKRLKELEDNDRKKGDQIDEYTKIIDELKKEIDRMKRTSI